MARLRPSALALAVAALALAGCIEGSPAMTAKQAVEVASAAARAWHADAQVAQVVGEDRSIAALNLTDGKPGDGHAPAWAVNFVSAQDPDHAYVVVVLGNRSILHQERWPLRMTTGAGGANVSMGLTLHPAVDWRVDSPQAAAAARGNASWVALEARAGGAAWQLFGGPNASHPVWLGVLTSRERIAADERGEASEEEGHVAGVVVDATTGALLDQPPAWVDSLWGSNVRSGTGGGVVVQEERGDFAGTLTRATPDEAHPFTIGAGHPALRVVVRAQPPSPAATLEVVLVLPDGGTLQAEAGTDPAEIVVEQPPAGDYTVEVHLGGPAGGIAARYAGCWVAQGFVATIPMPFPSGC
jgi:hypothetical protein